MKPKPGSTVYLYQVTASDQTYLTVAPSIDNAQAGIEERLNLPPNSAKARAYRIDGRPARIYLHPLLAGRRETETEQCWSENNAGTDRCQNQARPGFHTCKIHTSYSAPFPFGTPEFKRWEDEDDPKPSKRRSGTRTRKTAPKPAGRRAAPRDGTK